MSKIMAAVIGILIICPGIAFASGCGWFRGRPLPECSSFWVLEAGWEERIEESNVRLEKDNFLFTSSFGLMKNIGRKFAAGGILYLGGDDDAATFGICARGRAWLNRIISLDLDLGPLVSGSDNYADVKAPGFIGRISLGWGDLVAITAHYQSIPFKNLSYDTWNPNTDISQSQFIANGTQTSWYVGARFGSYAALALPLVLVVIYGAEAE